MTRLFGIPILLLAIGVAGCSTLACGDPHPYINSSARPSLQAPVGLSVPAPDPNYAIQGITPNVNKRTDRDAAGVCLINPPQLISAQPAAASKTSTAKPKSGPVPAPGTGQPAVQPGSKPKTPPAMAGTMAPPFAVAAPRVHGVTSGAF